MSSNHIKKYIPKTLMDLKNVGRVSVFVHISIWPNIYSGLWGNSDVAWVNEVEFCSFTSKKIKRIHEWRQFAKFTYFYNIFHSIDGAH